MTHSVLHMARDVAQVDPTVLALVAQVGDALTDAARFRMQTAVTEALFNLVLHPGPSAAATVTIEVQIDADAVRVGLTDPVGATPFDLRSHATALDKVDPLAESGRGLGLILECADTISYGPAGDVHRLDLGFSRAGADSPRQLTGG